MARYADKLLADGEQIVLRSRQHWLAPLIRGWRAWALFILSIVLVLLVAIRKDLNTLIGEVGGGLGLVLLILSLLLLAKVYLDWRSQDYIVTNRRVIKVDGILNKHSADSSLEKINDAILDQSLLGRMFGYGDLNILTAAEEEVDQYHMLDHPGEFKKVMLDQKHELETDFVRMPTPPLRASPAPAAAPAAAAATAPVGPVGPVAVAPSPPAEPARKAMGADEITATLSQLADLRDRGAISVEDYEAKKADLLARL
jgi:Bacterial PH domain/Short C-terminal domain